MDIVKHPSVVASTAALVVLAAAEVATDLPWWLWVAWAVLSSGSVVQAFRARSAS